MICPKLSFHAPRRESIKSQSIRPSVTLLSGAYIQDNLMKQDILIGGPEGNQRM